MPSWSLASRGRDRTSPRAMPSGLLLAVRHPVHLPKHTKHLTGPLPHYAADGQASTAISGVLKVSCWSGQRSWFSAWQRRIRTLPIPREARKHGLRPETKILPLSIKRLPQISGASLSREQAAQQKATLVVIDTAPHATPGVDVIAAAADLLLIPCRPSAFNLAAIASSVQVAKAAGKPAAFIMNACPARAPEVEETREVLES